jgi:hypothetical protein
MGKRLSKRTIHVGHVDVGHVDAGHVAAAVSRLWLKIA